MALRTVFYIRDNKINNKSFDIKWAGGFAVSQKRKNIDSLHEEIEHHFNVSKDRILEVSTKSSTNIGVQLSAMNLTVELDNELYFFESIYQSSKVFDDGLLGEQHYPEWKSLNGFEAKKASREINLPLKEFRYRDKVFPLNPQTLFFDWLYIKTISKKPDIYDKISKYDYFTDIEFIPAKMISCQAESLAKYKYLYEKGLVNDYLDNPIKYYSKDES